MYRREGILRAVVPTSAAAFFAPVFVYLSFRPCQLPECGTEIAENENTTAKGPVAIENPAYLQNRSDPEAPRAHSKRLRRSKARAAKLVVRAYVVLGHVALEVLTSGMSRFGLRSMTTFHVFPFACILLYSGFAR